MNQPENAWMLRRSSGMGLMLILCAAISGCAFTLETTKLFDLANRTTHVEPHFFEYVKSDRIAQREARLLAQQAWGEVAATVPDASADFENGFVEGFADYLYRGGNGEPPVIPPRGYWHLRFLNHFGKVTINEWYEGFRQGAANCKARGIREMWLVPTSLIAETPEPSDPDLPTLEQDLWSAETNSLNPDTLDDQSSTAEQLDEPPETPPIPEPGSDLTIADEQPAGTSTDSKDSQSEDEPTFDDGPAFRDELDGLLPNDNEQELPLMPEDNEPDQDDPFINDPESVPDDEKLFNIPNGEMEPEIPDFGPIDLQGNNLRKSRPLSIRSVGPAAPIPQQVASRTDLSTKIQQTSGQLELRPADGSRPTTIGRTQSRQWIRNNNLRPPPAEKEEPMRLIIEPSPARQPNQRPVSKPVQVKPKSNPVIKNKGNADIPETKYPVLNFDSFSPTSSSKNQKSRIDSNGTRSDFSFDDSLPSIPLHVVGPVTAEDIRWDPMEGVDAAPGFDGLNYRGVITSETIDKSTQWTAEMSRAKEVPLRIADSRAQNTTTNKSKPKNSPEVSSTQLKIKDHIDAALAPTRNPRGNQLPRIISRNDYQSLNREQHSANPTQLRIRD